MVKVIGEEDASLITLDTYKRDTNNGEAFNLSKSFNGRVGDEQVPLLVKFLERGKTQQFNDELVPFISGYVGERLDEHNIVTADTGIPVSYTGTRDDIMAMGMVKMNLPGTMFPQEGYFYGFLGLETPDHSKRVSTFSVWFHVYNGNPDMFVNRQPFRTELQKELDLAESLISKADGEIKAKLIEWQDRINKLIEEGNTDLDAYNQRLKTAEEKLALLLKEVKEAGLLTQADFDAQIKIVNENIENALNELKHPILIDDSLMIGNPVSGGEKSAIENLRAGIDDSLFNFVFITDTHYGRWDQVYTDNLENTLGIDNLNTALAMDGAVDAIISGGDNIDGWTDELDEMLYETKEYATDVLFETDNKSDKFILKGNHDDASGRLLDWYRGNRGLVYDSAPAVIKNQQIRDAYCNAELLFDEKRQDDSNYFYKDYPDKKIRLIGLDSNDTPDDILADDGAPKYYGIGHMGFQETQLKWLAEIALKNVPEDYTTVIVAHIQAENLSNGKDEFYYNQDCLQQIINDFMQGKSSVISGDVKDWEVDMQTDFTAQGPRMFAGYIHGHQHKEVYNSDLGFNNIGITCAIDPKTTAWNLITIDTVNHKVILKGFGRATNRKFDYLEA
ncbi:metallophosphoesterase [Pediococcus acidilactici]|uniref:metallophosphoesterase n=1 Tax=Pediococcus acidilactici TaxID=1254 RepID=UPI00232FCC06|nr:metallophosphoesterase [Pediococcus acidilactici]MDB8858801.1 metallophosphoesterase [Pediococcus acidilactici]MDB8861091.1 metallophosphoesterase [Pediococcus acidilactici]MDB8862017.1 metallophosphoesterase [Pediococcus acidilactici]MDB8865982.1 metallophosphoesterase [Pediococcus acidilactici]